jgi:hypothetical protein
VTTDGREWFREIAGWGLLFIHPWCMFGRKRNKGGVMQKSRLIVMPFVPESGQAFDGTGLGIHFLLGNLFGVHSGLTECWFGWRVKKIFQDGDAFSDYCRGRCSGPDIQALGRQEQVRY